ncbi:fimbrial biogenesis chaperone [Pseudomonas nitroreducens]|uniref:fimbrial biogenesis chaperone n=1 Tax=Pseudomonas nitroreducens TaxID=46680 RepID=UPI003CC82C9A
MHALLEGIVRKSCLTMLFGLSAALLASTASASVVVTGTRVIYPGDAREKTVQLTNQDPFPNVIQAWVDVNNPDSVPEKADAPFVLTPPMFRMEPKAGQNLRLLYTGSGLPQDRESVFYLNVLQIPPRNEAYKDQSQMLIMTRSRLKLFYRPSGIVGKPESLGKSLQFAASRQGNASVIEVSNPTGYFASFVEAKVVVGGREFALETSMVSPKSKAVWALAHGQSLPAGELTLRASLVNDYGSQIAIEHAVGH